jgi:hypothetical protein
MLTILLSKYPVATNGDYVASLAAVRGRGAQSPQAGMSGSVTFADTCVR